LHVGASKTKIWKFRAAPKAAGKLKPDSVTARKFVAWAVKQQNGSITAMQSTKLVFDLTDLLVDRE